MPRLHLFEFNDHPRVPQLLRGYETDYLETLFRLLRLYEAALPLVRKGLEHAPEQRIIDLAAGGGGPALTLAEHLDVPILLTDLYPNLPAFTHLEAHTDGQIRGHAVPVDLFDVPADLRGLRTMFDALHHFRPAEVVRLLESMARSGQPFLSLDATSRTLPMVLGSVLIPLNVWLLTPWMRPFRWSRLLLTYLLPILPLLIAWDGLVSHLRAYSADDLRALAAEVHVPGYTWETGTLRARGAPLTYILGIPHHD